MSSRYYFLIFFILLLKLNVIASNYRAIYDYEYTKDSINSIIGKDILYLDISDKNSFCFSYYTFQTDSLRSTPNGRVLWGQLFSAAIIKDGVNATAFPHRRSTFKITKFNNNDTVFIKDNIDQDIYLYKTLKNEFNWEITGNIKDINGYESYEAKCFFHGREWTVWFTPLIPINDGPWLFCGLPGLILEAKDKNDLFSFRLIRFTSLQNPITDWTERGKETNRIKFLKDKYKFYRNYNSLLNAEIGNIVSEDLDSRYLEGLEPDFKY